MDHVLGFILLPDPDFCRLCIAALERLEGKRHAILRELGQLFRREDSR
jgi:hypothetical protein